MRKLFVVSAALLALAAARVLAAGAPAQIIAVPGDFETIQQAVDAAEADAVINVAPGTYCERVTISTPGLRLRAAPAVGTGGAVLSGTACAAAGVGIGIHVAGVAGVEISGFTIEGYESGIVLHNATQTKVHLNEVRDNRYGGSTSPPYRRAQGILLIGSSFNEITRNAIHDNGHLGIGLYNGSNGNLIRANRLTDNQAQQSKTYPNFACSLMLWGATNSANHIVENEVSGSLGYGIMIGGGIQTGNLVAQNRVHGHPWPGIVVNAGSVGNVIQQNDVRGNGTDGDPDLWDYNASTVNLWQRNLGTCVPGNAGCE